MNEFLEETGSFFWGLAKGLVSSAIVQDFDHHLQEDYNEHPSESFGRHVGHAMGKTILDIFGSSQ